MEGVLWYVLASSRGGPTRVRILRALDERPRNANQLATELDLDYTTIRHHLDVLMENDVVERNADEYAAVYLFTDRARANWDVVEEVLETVDPQDERSAVDGDESRSADERPRTEDEQPASEGDRSRAEDDRPRSDDERSQPGDG